MNNESTLGDILEDAMRKHETSTDTVAIREVANRLWAWSEDATRRAEHAAFDDDLREQISIEEAVKYTNMARNYEDLAKRLERAIR